MNNKERRNREKKEEKLGSSISNHKIGFLNFVLELVTLVVLKLRHETDNVQKQSSGGIL